MYLPKSLQVEEEALLALEDGNTNGGPMMDKKGLEVSANSRLADNSTDIDARSKEKDTEDR